MVLYLSVFPPFKCPRDCNTPSLAVFPTLAIPLAMLKDEKISQPFFFLNFLILKTEFSMTKIQPRLRAGLSTKFLLNQAKNELVAPSNRTKFPQTSLQ
jgi:hypothetical protein